MNAARTGRAPKPLPTAIALVAVAAVVVGTALVVVGPDFAQGVYLGLVLLAMAARRLDPPWLFGAAAAVTAVSAAAAAASGPVGLLLCLIAACLIQVPFARRSIGGLTVLPVLAALYGLIDSPDVSALRVGLGTAFGALLVVCLAIAVRQPFALDAATDREAWAYGALLAAGCAALWAAAQVLDIARLHWSILAFCATFVPWARVGPALGPFVAATGGGALIAVIVGALAPTPAVAVCLVAFAVAVVFFAITGDPVRYLLVLTPTVVLAASLGAGTRQVVEIAAQRGAAVLVGGFLTVLALAAWGRTVGPPDGDRSAPGAPETTGGTAR